MPDKVRIVISLYECAAQLDFAGPVQFFARLPDVEVVRGGNVITGGGVTAGIDFALSLIAELRGDEAAQAVQLNLEYAPEPPFTAGRPEIAPPEILRPLQRKGHRPWQPT